MTIYRVRSDDFHVLLQRRQDADAIKKSVHGWTPRTYQVMERSSYRTKTHVICNICGVARESHDFHQQQRNIFGLHKIADSALANSEATRKWLDDEAADAVLGEPLKMPKYRIFVEGTIKGNYESNPHARFYDTMDEAVQRANEILNEGRFSEPLYVFRSVAKVSPMKIQHNLEYIHELKTPKTK